MSWPPFLHMIPEEGDGIANMKEKEVVMETSPHSQSERLVHSDS